MNTVSIRLSLWSVAAIAGILMPVAPHALQQGPSADPTTMDALLKASPGTYLVTAGPLGAAAADAAVPVFVQGDTYRAGAEGMRASLAVGATVSERWTLQFRLERAGKPVPGTAADPPLTGDAGIVRAIREFPVEPGSYEAVVALARAGTDRRWTGTVVRYPLSVPNLPASQLVASPILLGEKAESATGGKPVGPFIFGKTRLTPAVGSRFRQSDNLHIASRIHGWKRDTTALPDLSVDYVFRQHTGNRIRFFNKTKTQLLNTQTLGKGFDGDSGAVATGMTVPLAAFPPGEFEVDLRILDKRTKLSVEQKARFSVVE